MQGSESKKLSDETWHRLAEILGFLQERERGDRILTIYIEGMHAFGWAEISTYGHLCDNGNPELRTITDPRLQTEILMCLELERQRQGLKSGPRRRKAHKGPFAHEARLAELIQTCTGLPESRLSDFYARFHGAYNNQGLRGLRLWVALVTDFPEADGVSMYDVEEILRLLEVREEWRGADR